MLQIPAALAGSVIWKYIDANKERRNIRKAFECYLPNDVVEQISNNITDIKTSSRIVYGICLSTDAGQYTSLSEAMEPDELGRLMNRYYEIMFEQVIRHSGFVSNVIGDSMLAIWVAAHPEPALLKKACLAALDITAAVHQFNQSSNVQLPTRVGLHSGKIFLGNIGAINRYEYRPVGDIVNTATRLEGLNKYLGTRILVSDDVINQLDGLFAREIGKFLMVGKSKPVLVYELICRIEDSDERQRDVRAKFTEALAAFRRRSWGNAINKFNESVRILGEDGPSSFYLRQCENYKTNPPSDSWNGILQMDKK